MNVAVSAVTIGGLGSGASLALELVDAGNGKIKFMRGDETFQQLPDGSYKFDKVDNPGPYELATSGAQAATWTPADGICYSRTVLPR